MMLRVLGAVLIVCGTSGWGLYGVMRLRRRCRILAELTGAVGAVRSEITTRLTPVPELIARMARECPEPVGLFFTHVEKRLVDLGISTLYGIWEDALKETPELMLMPDEKDSLKEIPRALGRYELEEQRLALIRTERQFEQFLKRAEITRERDSKIKGFFGVAAGIFIVLLLI